MVTQFFTKKKLLMVFLALVCSALVVFINVASLADTDSTFIPVPKKSSKYIGKNYEDVVAELTEAGFTNISTEAVYDLEFSLFADAGDIESITIDGSSEFKKKETFNRDVPIVITYRMSCDDDPVYRTYDGVVYDYALYLSEADGLKAHVYTTFIFSESTHSVIRIKKMTAGRDRTFVSFGTYKGSFNDSMVITMTESDGSSKKLGTMKKHTSGDNSYWAFTDSTAKHYAKADVKDSINDIPS